MIYDYIIKEEVLLRKSLNCYPAENQAAKIYHEFIINHPELNIKDVDCRIESVEREEDYYGNGGGYDRTLIIFTRRKESETERNERIKTYENQILEKYELSISDLLRNMVHDIKDFSDNSKSEFLHNINKYCDTYIKRNL